MLGAILLGVIALFSFGGVNFFSKPERFVVYFNESIHGLDEGSPVKLRGVRIGRVVGMKVRAIPSRSADEPRSVVAVVCELSRDVVANASGEPVDVSDRGELQHLVDEGLRAQLGVIGYATGLLYVELDFYNPKTYPARPREGAGADYLELPAVPSKSAEFLRSLEEILSDVKRIDFAELGAQIEGLLVDTRRQINAADLGRVAREWADAGKAISGFVESPEAKQLLANAASASARLDYLLADLEKSVGPSGDQLNLVLSEARTALADFTETATIMKRFINAQQNLGDDASKAFVRIGDAASAVARLADFLERNPNALLSGRSADSP